MFDTQLPDDIENHLLKTLTYLEKAYGEQKRKVGTPAMLHPIRSAAILAQAHDSSSILDVLTALFHDKDEDILPERYSPVKWNELEVHFRNLVEKIESNENWFLNERIYFLARRQEESYEEYLCRLINQAKETPELLKIKLADRLDNTLDLRLDFQSETEHVNFYNLIFRLLFDRTYKGLNIRRHHSSTHKILGAKRLHEIYKNFIFFSLLLSADEVFDNPSQWLLKSLVKASITEAWNIILHIFSYHLTKPDEQRRLVLDMSVNKDMERDNHILNDVITYTFSHVNRRNQNQQLDELYKDKKRMGQVAIAFVVLFGSYLNNEDVL